MSALSARQVLCLGALAGISGTARAQATLFDIDGAIISDAFGSAVASAGDLIIVQAGNVAGRNFLEPAGKDDNRFQQKLRRQTEHLLCARR